MLQELDKRIQEISQQLSNTNQQVLSLTEQLSIAKNQVNQLTGHLNEAGYLKEQFLKFQEESKKKSEPTSNDSSDEETIADSQLHDEASTETNNEILENDSHSNRY